MKSDVTFIKCNENILDINTLDFLADEKNRRRTVGSIGDTVLCPVVVMPRAAAVRLLAAHLTHVNLIYLRQRPWAQGQFLM